MKNLLQIEWLKVRKYKVFWILFLLYGLASISINYIMYKINNNVSSRSGGQIRMHLFEDQHIWHTTAWLTNFTLLLPGFLMIVLITNEFSFRTLRQSIINGQSRLQAILAKWISLFMLAVACWLFYFIIVLVTAVTITSNTQLFVNFQYAGFVFLKILLALSVALILALWIKRAGLAIALYLFYYLLFEEIAGHFLDRIDARLSTFLPLSAGTGLIPSPFSELINGKSTEQLPQLYMAISIAWIVAFIVLSVYYIRRTDL